MSSPSNNSICGSFVVSCFLAIALNDPLLAQCKPYQSKVDWTTMASKYTHDMSGQRVDQYALPVAPPSFERPDFQRSGYRHYRSTLQVGNSADNYHVVDQWGGQVRPYEEWRFPFRPYSAPYGLWGPQPPAVGIYPTQGGLFGPYGANFLNAPFGNVPNGFGGFGLPNGIPINGVPGNVPGNGVPPNGFPGPGFPGGFPGPLQPNFPGNNGTGQPPWIDGYWPNAPQDPQMSDRAFFNIPRP